MDKKWLIRKKYFLKRKKNYFDIEVNYFLPLIKLLKKIIKNKELLREHNYLKEKITSLQLEVRKRSEFEENFNQEIEELSQETENLVTEIEKWQT